jgi:hypothetical protein
MIAIPVDLDKFQYKLKNVTVVKSDAIKHWVLVKVPDANLDDVINHRVIAKLGNVDVRKFNPVDIITDYGIDDDHYKMVDKYVPDSRTLTKPYKYDYTERTFYNRVNNGRSYPAVSECTPHAYWKFCVSLIGNPTNFIVATVNRDVYHELVKNNVNEY